MALKCFDGFDHYNSITDFERRSSFIQYERPVGSASYSFVTGRNGYGKAFQFSSFISGTSHGLYCSYGGSRNPNNFFGMAISQGNNVGMIFNLFDSVLDTQQCAVYFNPNNYAVQFYRGEFTGSGGTLIGASENNVWFGGAFNYFEIWPVVNNSSGGLKVYFNNNLICNISGVDSQVTANAWWDMWELTGDANNRTLIIDDHYVCDTTVGPGLSPYDTPLGDSKVSTLWATGDNHVMWTPLTGSDNFAMIDEIAMDSDTTYNSTTGINDEDIFAFQTLPGGVAHIHAIQLTGAYRKDDALVRTIVQELEISAIVYPSPDTHNVPDVSYSYFVDLWVINPNTILNWTVIDVNGIAAGYKLVA